jgi:hypothetical protein
VKHLLPISSSSTNRNQRAALIVLSLVLLFLTPVSASYAEARAFIDGQELLRLCDSAAESHYSRATDCLGYVTGLSDSHEVFHDLGLIPKQWCWPPEGISNRKMAAIVHKYLQSNITVLDKSAALLSSLALYEAYPCQG